MPYLAKDFRVLAYGAYVYIILAPKRLGLNCLQCCRSLWARVQRSPRDGVHRHDVHHTIGLAFTAYWME